MKPNILKLSIVILFVIRLFAYTNLSNEEVHNRLLAGDTLLLLDVREVSEYESDHIAEPEGMLPITPANFPINSFVLSNEIHRLPKDIDIIVHCWSGGRSVSASLMLDNNGFTRIYNMLGGFSSWPYESRNSGFGDHSGKWIDKYIDFDPAIITSPDGTGSITLSNSAIPETEIKFYLELHKATSAQLDLFGISHFEQNIYYQITALNEFGLSMFDGDSLVLLDTVELSLVADIFEEHQFLKSYIPGKGWQNIDFEITDGGLLRKETILRKWYQVGKSISTAITEDFSINDKEIQMYPNPFNNELKIITPVNAKISVYDIRGRLIEKLDSQMWVPDLNYRSGIYYIKVEYANRVVTKKVTYLK